MKKYKDWLIVALLFLILMISRFNKYGMKFSVLLFSIIYLSLLSVLFYFMKNKIHESHNYILVVVGAVLLYVLSLIEYAILTKL